MNDKLTIQELAAYLPYSLKAEMLDYKIDYVGKQYDEIIGIHQWDKLCLYWSALTVGGSKPNIERIKPLLLPLSSLTKEIEHKGDKFVPIEKLNEMFSYKDMRLVYYTNSGLGWEIDSSFANTALSFEEMYLPFLKLAEWHVDFQNLIPQGKAIDKTTIL